RSVVNGAVDLFAERHPIDPDCEPPFGAVAEPFTLSLGYDVDKRGTIQSKCHRSAEVGIVEGRYIPVGEQTAVDPDPRRLANRLRHLALHISEQRHREAIGERTSRRQIPESPSTGCG